MAYYPAVRGTAMIVSGRRKIDMRDKILKLQPSQTPFRVFTAKMGRRKATSYKFEWIEDSFDPRIDDLGSGGITGGGTSEDGVVVDNVKYFKAGDVLLVIATGEKVWIDTITYASNTIDITKVASGNITAAAENTKLMIIGNAFEEGSGKGTEYVSQLVLPYNYTQIFKTDFGITGTAGATEYYGGKERARLRAKKGIEHNLDIELAMLFGERGEFTGGTHTRRFMRGAVTWIEDGGYNISTDDYDTVTVDVVESWLSDMFDNGEYGSDQRIAFCGPDIITLFNSFALPAYRMKTGEKKFGIPIMRYQSAHGELILVKEPLFANSSLTKYAVIVDPKNMNYVYLQTRDTTFWANVEDNSVDGAEDEYISEISMEMSLMPTHGLWKLAG